jgi:hypothetical protein
MFLFLLAIANKNKNIPKNYLGMTPAKTAQRNPSSNRHKKNNADDSETIHHPEQNHS